MAEMTTRQAEAEARGMLGFLKALARAHEVLAAAVKAEGDLKRLEALKADLGAAVKSEQAALEAVRQGRSQLIQDAKTEAAAEGNKVRQGVSEEIIRLKEQRRILQDEIAAATATRDRIKAEGEREAKARRATADAEQATIRAETARLVERRAEVQADLDAALLAVTEAKRERMRIAREIQSAAAQVGA